MSGDLGVVAVADVAHEGVLTVELVPRESEAGVGHGVVDLAAAFAGNVRILPAPDHEHLGLDLGGAIKGAVVASFA